MEEEGPEGATESEDKGEREKEEGSEGWKG